jgi:hypothetical protein
LIFAFVVTKLLPPNVKLKVPVLTVKVPVKVKLLERVIVVVPVVVILFQVIPFVTKVQLPPKFKVDKFVIGDSDSYYEYFD